MIALWVLLSAVVWRVTRFVIADTLIDRPRRWWRLRLLNPDRPDWFRKVDELLLCPYCLSVWVAAGVVAATLPFTSVPLPMWMWLACATGSMILWAIIESDD